MKILNLLLICSILSATACAQSSYPYEPIVVNLTGTLTMESRFGPPNFGETPDQDEEIEIFILELDTPITVGTEQSLSELNSSIVADVSEVQVIAGDEAAALTAQVGDRITLSGTLSQQISSHDFLPVVFRLSD